MLLSTPTKLLFLLLLFFLFYPLLPHLFSYPLLSLFSYHASSPSSSALIQKPYKTSPSPPLPLNFPVLPFTYPPPLFNLPYPPLRLVPRNPCRVTPLVFVYWCKIPSNNFYCTDSIRREEEEPSREGGKERGRNWKAGNNMRREGEESKIRSDSNPKVKNEELLSSLRVKERLEEEKKVY